MVQTGKPRNCRRSTPAGTFAVVWTYLEEWWGSLRSTHPTFWQRVIDFQFLADQGTIADADLELVDFAETAAEAWQIVLRGPRGEGSGMRG